MRSIFLLTFCCLLIHSAKSQQWVQTNGPEGGTIHAFCANGNTYFAAPNGAGVMLSSDNGDHWTPTSFPKRYVFALVTAHDSIVFAGSSEGLYKSSDLGLTWSWVSDISATSLMVKGDTLWAAGGSNANEFYSSFDLGATWTAPLNNGMTASSISALAYYGNKIFAGTSQGVFVSSDNGDHWVAANNGIPAFNQNIFTIYFHGSTLFAGGTNDNGLFRSTNFGANWTAANISLPNVYAITGSATTIYAASACYARSPCNAVYRSTDNGNSWTPLANTGLINSSIWSLLVDNGRLFAGTYGGGIFLSNDQGNTWAQKNSGVKSAEVFSLAVKDGFILVGTMGDGIHKSSDNGQTWELLNTYTIGPGWENINAPIGEIAVNKNSIFANGWNGLIRSTDDGQTWQVLNTPFAEPLIGSFTFASDTLFATLAEGSIIRSTDNGNNWSNIGKINNGGGFTTNTMVVNGSSIFVGSSDGIFVSRDRGATWSLSKPSATTPYVFALKKMGGVLVAGTELGIFFSTDNGHVWTSTNISNITIYSLYEYGSTLYAGAAFGGAFYSVDNGATWTQLGQYFGDVRALAAIGDKLFAGTGDTGAWSISLPCSPPPQPTITITYSKPGEITFHSSGSEGNQWFLNGVPITGATDSIYSTIVPGKYSVQVTISGCKSAISFTASCSTPPEPTIHKVSGSPSQATIYSSALIGNQWFFNGVPIPGATDSTYTATIPGAYTVQTSLGGCKSVMSVAFHFEIQYPDPQIEMPNVFTPNDDDKNPVFKPKVYDNIKSGSLTIIDRWGREIFETSNPENGWDGGKSDSGTYFYFLRYLGLNGKTGTAKGWVEIIR